MSQSTRLVPGAYDAIEKEFEQLASRLADDIELELEEIYWRANQRLEEACGHALAQSVPAEHRLQQLGERLG